MGEACELDEIGVNELPDGFLLQYMNSADNRLGDSGDLYGMRKPSTTEAFGSNLSNLSFSLKSPERPTKRQVVEIPLKGRAEDLLTAVQYVTLKGLKIPTIGGFVNHLAVFITIKRVIKKRHKSTRRKNSDRTGRWPMAVC
jgi:hypothetical protein